MTFQDEKGTEYGSEWVPIARSRRIIRRICGIGASELWECAMPLDVHINVVQCNWLALYKFSIRCSNKSRWTEVLGIHMYPRRIQLLCPLPPNLTHQCILGTHPLPSILATEYKLMHSSRNKCITCVSFYTASGLRPRAIFTKSDCLE